MTSFVDAFLPLGVLLGLALWVFSTFCFFRARSLRPPEVEITPLLSTDAALITAEGVRWRRRGLWSMVAFVGWGLLLAVIRSLVPHPV